jgi:GTP-binding protein
MQIRNIAIIAHVDHGKTTLVDGLLRQSKTKLNKETVDVDCIMDSNELEKERGITIFSKNASVVWQGVKINIIDTPGHADFSGEVERVLQLADGSLLLVDAQEGPMPQTRFVLKKALELKHKIIVVINKIDKPNANIVEALNRTFDLFIDLGADEETIDFPVVYASSKLGKAGLSPELDKMENVTPLFEEIVKHIPAPKGDAQKPLQMMITSTNWDNFKGRIGRGRIVNGEIKAGQEVVLINRQGEKSKHTLTSLMVFEGLETKEADQATVGEIVAVAGIPKITIGETVADPLQPEALPLLKIEEPTVRMTLSVNSSPFAGKEGKFSTSRQIGERIVKELENDVALQITDGPSGGWVVAGRGELHLAILIERLRREGYEFQVSQPQVIVKKINGQTLIPYEEAFIEVPQEYQGAVIQKLNSRQAELREVKTNNDGITHLEFILPTESLFGYRGEFLTDTHGTGIINTSFYQYAPSRGQIIKKQQGSLVASQDGETRLYGLTHVQDRGELFVGPGEKVYQGQVVGQNSRGDDIWVNVCKEKQLSNMRSKGEGTAIHFNAPKIMELEDALGYINESELVEVTPKSIRIRKIILNETDEKRRQKGLQTLTPKT